MPITPQILEQPAGAHKPFSKLEALAIDEALDTHGYVYAARNGRLVPHILDGWKEERFPRTFYRHNLKIVFRDLTCKNRALLFAEVNAEKV